jgi:hypothetical protein
VFFEHSRQVYGEPTDPLRFIPATPLELAQSVQDVILNAPAILTNLSKMPGVCSGAE